MSMIKPKLTLFQMQYKSMSGNSIEFSQPSLGKAPERFNAIDMIAASDKFIVAMIAPKVLVKSNIHQTIIARPAIGMDDTFGLCLASDNVRS